MNYNLVVGERIAPLLCVVGEHDNPGQTRGH